MHRAVLVVSLLAACRFDPALGAGPTGGSDAGHADAPQLDASADGPPDSAPPTCMTRWRAATPPTLTAPSELAASVVGKFDRDPALSPDGLRLYFSSDRGDDPDFWELTRARATDAFTGSASLGSDLSDDVESEAAESKLTMTAAQLDIIFTSTRDPDGNPTGGAHLWHAHRANLGAQFDHVDQAGVAAPSGAGTGQSDPSLAGSDLKLYFAEGTNTGQRIAVSLRTDLTSDFGSPALVTGLGTSSHDADPWVSDDETLMLFSSEGRGSGVGVTDIWYTTRGSAGDPFGAPRLVPGINSTSQDGDPTLSADGCELFFASDRATSTGDYDLWTAKLTP